MTPATRFIPFARELTRYASAIAALALLTNTWAQTPAPAAPAAAPAAPPSWQQGRSSEQGTSTLHPFAPLLTGRPASELPLDKLKLPPGFKIEVWVDGVPEARSLALGDKGTVFVGNRNLSDVYAIVDKGGKREVKKILKGLSSPNGVAFSKGTLYVAERGRITRYDGIEDRLDNPPEAKVVIDNLDPSAQPGHFWKFLALGPDGKLYFNVGAPGNIVMPNYMQAAIHRVDPKTGVMENVAHGVRNSVGFDWHPQTKQLWFTNHGRDWISDDMPNDTLHRVTHKSMDYGYPFCHQGDFLDPEFGKSRSCKEFDPPALKLGPHIAPLGMRFYTGKMFPPEYRNNIFIAMHGSWNRSVKQGYNVMRVSFDGKGTPKMEPFLTGFLTDEKADPPMWGRPVDVMMMRDGAMLVSDDYNGIIYRISYKEVEVRIDRSVSGRAAVAFIAAALPFLACPQATLAADAAAGMQKAQVCVACHGPDGNSVNPVVPSLAGQPAQFIATQLLMFREGKRKDAQMAPFAANLSNADLNNIAAYFTAQKPAPPAFNTAAGDAEAGPRLAQKFNCVQCHGPALLGQQHIPRLAGQQHEYLKVQLRGFRASTRFDMDGQMSSAAQALSDADIEILANYLAGIK